MLSHLVGSRKPGRVPPGPRGLELIRYSARMMTDPLRCVSEVQARFGDVARIKMGLTDLHLVCDPALLEKIFISEADNYGREIMARKMTAVFGRGLLTSEGPEWKRQRFLMQPAFRHARLESYSQAMISLSGRMLEDWKAGETRDVHEEMMRLTLDVACATLFGTTVDDDARIVGECLRTIMEYAFFVQSVLMFFPSPEILPVPVRARYRQAVRDFDGVVERTLALRTRRGDLESSEDLLAVLVRSRNEGGWMTPKLLRDNMITVFLAGHETTALTLTYCLYLLARHPEAERRLHDEVDEVLKGKSPSHADLPRLCWTEAIVKEAMRVYPPVWVVGRAVLRDCELGGHPLKQGDELMMPQWVVHRDPRWFADPLRFRPERWLPGGQSIPRFAYFPFGGGARVCIGNYFSVMEATLVLAGIARRFRLTEVSPKESLDDDLMASITIRPKSGMRMRLEAREKVEQ